MNTRRERLQVYRALRVSRANVLEHSFEERPRSFHRPINRITRPCSVIAESDPTKRWWQLVVGASSISAGFLTGLTIGYVLGELPYATNFAEIFDLTQPLHWLTRVSMFTYGSFGAFLAGDFYFNPKASRILG